MKTLRIIHTYFGLMAFFSAFIFSPAIGGEVVSVDRHLVKYDSGVIYDAESGLEWYAGPDKGTSWEEAERWVAGLNVADGEWRMPSKDELDTLEHVGDGVRNITVLLANSGYWIWAGQTPGASSRWVFGFSYGGEGWSGLAPDDGGRAIAVRYRKKWY